MADRSSTLGAISVVDALAEELRRRILDGEIPSGTALREVELASSYDTARNTVRAALQQLVHDGLLQRQRHRGVVVTSFTAEALGDIFGVRLALEREAVRSIRATGRSLDPAVRALDALADVVDQPWRDVIAADLEFHHALVVCAANARLASIHRGLIGELQLAMSGLAHREERRGSLVTEHAALLDAVRSGDESDRLLVEHLQTSLADTTELLTPTD